MSIERDLQTYADRVAETQAALEKAQFDHKFAKDALRQATRAAKRQHDPAVKAIIKSLGDAVTELGVSMDTLYILTENAPVAAFNDWKLMQRWHNGRRECTEFRPCDNVRVYNTYDPLFPVKSL